MYPQQGRVVRLPTIRSRSQEEGKRRLSTQQSRRFSLSKNYTPQRRSVTRNSSIMRIMNIYHNSLTSNLLDSKVNQSPQYTAFRRRKKQRGLQKSRNTEKEVPCAQLMVFHQTHLHGSQETQKSMILSFGHCVMECHPLLGRCSPVITETLLQLGSIGRYDPQSIVHAQKVGLNHLGLIIWGQAVLRRQHHHKTMVIGPGFALGDQKLFERSAEEKSFPYETTESCVTVTDCGLLWVSLGQWSCLSEQLTVQRCRQTVLHLSSLLMRGYLQKKEFRRQMGVYINLK